MNVQCLIKKQRRAVEAGQEQELTLDEINAEIRAVRKKRRKKKRWQAT